MLLKRPRMPWLATTAGSERTLAEGQRRKVHFTSENGRYRKVTDRQSEPPVRCPDPAEIGRVRRSLEFTAADTGAPGRSILSAGPNGHGDPVYNIRSRRPLRGPVRNIRSGVDREHGEFGHPSRLGGAQEFRELF